jgi:phosphoribosylformimino-5-aminoimidazole carboxamide ribotide isomerase
MRALYQGDYAHETIYGEDAVAMAQKFESEGATRLHVVDLDGARDGTFHKLRNHQKHRADFEDSGANRRRLARRKAINRVLEAGVQRCIIGTKAAQEPQWAQQMFAQFGDAIILGLDARDGMVSVAGWREDSGLPAVHFAQTMQNFGCARIIFTDIARDGTLLAPTPSL